MTLPRATVPIHALVISPAEIPLRGMESSYPDLQLRFATLPPSEVDLSWADLVIREGFDHEMSDSAAGLPDLPTLCLIPDAEASAARPDVAYSAITVPGPLPHLAVVIDATARGFAVWDPGLVAQPDLTERAASEQLTLREGEILRLLALGKSNKAIAEVLGLSENTVKSHVSAVLAKLQAGSRTEAVAIAARRGLVML